MAITLFEPLHAHLNAILTNYVGTTASNITQEILPVATTLALISISLYGWSMMRGLINEPVVDATAKILRICVIFSLSTNVGLYNQYLSDWLWQSPDALANLVIQNGNGGSSSISFSFLDNLLSQYYERGKIFWDLGNSSTIPNFGFLIIGCAVWLAGFLVTGYAAFLLILSKMALAVLLGVGAIFVLLTLFDSTRKFFDAWIGQVINFVFLNMVTVAVAGIMLSIIDEYAHGMVSVADIVDAFPMLGLSIISILLLYQVPSIASVLGGGVALNTLKAGSAALDFARNFEPRKLSASRKNLNTNAGIVSGQRFNKPVGINRKNTISKM